MDGSNVLPAVGIDLGTTYSCVGVWRHGQVEIVPNDQGNRITPSSVAFTDVRRLIGEASMNQIGMNATNTIFDAKRLIGRRFSDDIVQQDMKLWPFKVIKGTNDIPNIVVSHMGEEKRFCAEEISAMVLTKMKDIAETYLGETVENAVITVPAYFTDSQRQATKDAGRVAGLNVLQMLNEPTSAAIAYGLDNVADTTREKNVLVFDLGGGTFDVSLVTIDRECKLTVKAVDGDTHLGGQDFDNKMVDHCVKEFYRKHKKDISGNPKVLGKLRVHCERAKRTLSSTTEATIEVDGLYQGIDFFLTISRAKFENLNADYFAKCIETVERCLNAANVSKKLVDEVVLVGGSTRIPKVRSLLQDFFDGKQLYNGIHADEAVANGATILAARLSGKKGQNLNKLEFWDVTPLSLGVEAYDDTISVVIEKNTPMPARKERDYVTIKDNQPAIIFNVYEGVRPRPIHNNWLGKFEVDVPRAPRGESRVKVVFAINANGILKCSGEEETTGFKKKIRIDKGRLSKEEIEKMVRDSKKYKLEDQEYKKKVTARNKLEEYIYVVQNKIKTIGNDAKTRIRKKDLKKLEKAIEDANQYIGVDKLVDVGVYEMMLNNLENLQISICHS
uniref:heat shock cognate 70 kDa protein-like n=1 Tax=Erigeron canadensis TaxID=72917 RepID=UPI001CB9BD76|nr:heat shock cognate 70 kDa protein-like [Erigeron canadensis]XP_043607798.1 heat shock cognate 70 kDa protein-like [Erigeron canadensis]